MSAPETMSWEEWVQWHPELPLVTTPRPVGSYYDLMTEGKRVARQARRDNIETVLRGSCASLPGQLADALSIRVLGSDVRTTR